MATQRDTVHEAAKRPHSAGAPRWRTPAHTSLSSGGVFFPTGGLPVMLGAEDAATIRAAAYGLAGIAATTGTGRPVAASSSASATAQTKYMAGVAASTVTPEARDAGVVAPMTPTLEKATSARPRSAAASTH